VSFLSFTLSWKSLTLQLLFGLLIYICRWPRELGAESLELRAVKGPDFVRAKQFSTETRDERTRGQWQAGSAIQFDANSTLAEAEIRMPANCQWHG